MARGDYNGFSPDDQKRGGQIQTTAFGNGMLVREWNCVACLVEGKRPGDIIAHLEDYSNPIEGAIWLCYRCHTVLHARFEYPTGWDDYRLHIRSGIQWPLIRSYRNVIEMHCISPPEYIPRPRNERRESTILDVIESGDLVPSPEAYENMKLIHERGIKFFKDQQSTLF